MLKKLNPESWSGDQVLNGFRKTINWVSSLINETLITLQQLFTNLYSNKGSNLKNYR